MNSFYNALATGFFMLTISSCATTTPMTITLNPLTEESVAKLEVSNTGVSKLIYSQLTSPAKNKYASYLIDDNSGKFMSPYTSDGIVAGWVGKGRSASMGSAVGGALGAYAGRKAMENIPFIGGFLGKRLGNAAGRSIALKAIGGEAFLRESSDQSFNTLNGMALYLVDNYMTHNKFAEVVKLTEKIYPGFQKAYLLALKSRY